MLRTLHAVGAWAGVALGAVHVLFTAVAYERFSLGAFWFAGSGFALVFAGFLNLMVNRNAGVERLSRWLCHTANVVCTALFAVAVFLIGEPQVFFGLFIFAFETVAAVLLPGAAARERGEVI